MKGEHVNLLAYCNIDDLHEVAKANGIDIPRLRGYQLCSDMEPWTEKEIQNAKWQIEYEACESLCCTIPFWSTKNAGIEYSYETDVIRDYYLDKENKRIRWDRIHGWKRRVLKTYIHNRTKKFNEFVKCWNKYAGKDGVLRVHSRMGGNNWTQYWRDINGHYSPTKFRQFVEQDWIIEKIDDWWDETYCDIYCKIEDVVNASGGDEI